MTLKAKAMFKKFRPIPVEKDQFNAVNDIDLNQIKNSIYEEGEGTYNPEIGMYCVTVETQPCSAKASILRLGKFFKTPPNIDAYLLGNGRVHSALEPTLWKHVANPMQVVVSKRLNKLPDARRDHIHFLFAKNWTNNSSDKRCDTNELLACVNRRNLVKIREKYVKF